MASKPTDLINEKCSTKGCGKPVRSRGFCVACYYRHLRNGDFEGINSRRKQHCLSEINEETKTAVCKTCGDVKIVSRGQGKWRCAKEANHRSKLYKQAYRQSRKEMLVDKCEVCGSTERLRWDHCHVSGEFRGTLCDACNKGLGLFRDDPERLRKAAIYLEDKNASRAL